MDSNVPLDLLHWALAFFPMLLLLMLLVFFRWKAAEAGAVGVLCTLLIAYFFFETSIYDLAVSSAKGAWESIYILYVIWPAMILYVIGLKSGAFDSLNQQISKFSRNEMFLVLGFGWVFASFLQGISGFGTPIAITAPILVALGVRPVYAVAITLIGHAWANMFGTLAVSWIATNQVVTLGNPEETAFQTAAMLAVINASGGFMLAWFYGRMAGVRHALPLILIVAVIHGIGQIVLSTVNPVLSNFIPGTIALMALYPLSKWPRYSNPIPAYVFERPAMAVDRNHWAERTQEGQEPAMSLGMALFPYVLLILIAVPMLVIEPITALISKANFGLPFPRIETGYGVVREAVESFKPVSPFNHPGFFVMLTVVITWFVFRSKGYLTGQHQAGAPGFWTSVCSAAIPTSLAVVSYLIMSLVLDHTGQTTALAFGIKEMTPSGVFAFLSVGIGIFGAFMTSSNTASNVLFSPLQNSIAEFEGLPQSTIIASQSAGGAIGNAIAPANAVLGTSTTGIVGKEGEILRLTLPWTLAIALVIGLVSVLFVWVV